MQPPRIDAHLHFWQPARGDYGWLTPALGPLYRDFGPADYAAFRAAAGIERAVLVQAAPTLAETRWLLEQAAATGWVAAVVGWADLAAPDAPEVLARLAENPLLRGVRPMIQDIADPDWMLRPELGPAFAALERLGLRFDALVRPQHLPRLRRLLDRLGPLAICLDHGAKPAIAEGGFRPWADDIAALARDPRLVCKLSGLVTEAGAEPSPERLRPYVEHLLLCFGPQRLLWGSDWPVVTLGGGVEAWWRTTGSLLAGLSEDERAAVLGGTAARFYAITAQA